MAEQSPQKRRRHTRVSFLETSDVYAMGMRACLETQSDFKIGFWVSTDEFIETHLIQKSPDVLLIDAAIGMDRLFGLAKLLHDQYPKVRTLVLAWDPRSLPLPELENKGINGIAAKNSDWDDIAAAIRSVAAGNRFGYDGYKSFGLQKVPASAADPETQKRPGLEWLLLPDEISLPDPPFHFSNREREVADLLNLALQNKEIAAPLASKWNDEPLCVGTIRQYLHLIFLKTGASTRSELMLFCRYRLGLRPEPQALKEVLEKMHGRSQSYASSKKKKRMGWTIPFLVPASIQPQEEVIVLTLREIKLVVGVGLGYANKEIAYQESLTTGSVRVFLFNLYKKIGATNREEALLFAVAHDLLPKERVQEALRAMESRRIAQDIKPARVIEFPSRRARVGDFQKRATMI